MLHRLPAQVILKIFTHLPNFNACSALLLTSEKFRFIYHESKPTILCSIARNYVRTHPEVVALTVENPFSEDGLEDFELELEEDIQMWRGSEKKEMSSDKYVKENCSQDTKTPNEAKEGGYGERKRLLPEEIKDATKIAARARTALVHEYYHVRFNPGPLDEEASIRFQNAIFQIWKLCIQFGNQNRYGARREVTELEIPKVSDEELKELSKVLAYLRRLVTELIKRICPASPILRKYASFPQQLQLHLLSLGPGVLLTIYETSDLEIQEKLFRQQIEKACLGGAGIFRIVDELEAELEKRGMVR